MNKRILQWCWQHDWGCDARLVKGKIVILTYGELHTFTEVKDLMIWAGY